MLAARDGGDSAGKSVLVDLFERFGLKQQQQPILIGDVRSSTLELLDMIEDSLGATPHTGVRALCGRNFWRQLMTSKDIRETYLNTQMAAALRGDPGVMPCWGIEVDSGRLFEWWPEDGDEITFLNCSVLQLWAHKKAWYDELNTSHP